MKKNIVIAVMAGLAVLFFYLWRGAEMNSNSHKKKVAELAETIGRQMKRGEENFEWKMFIERMGIETLLKKYWEISDSDKHNDIEIEMRERLLNYGGNPVEPLEILVEKMLKDSFGKDQLINFVGRAKKTIRIYEEERKR